METGGGWLLEPPVGAHPFVRNYCTIQVHVWRLETTREASMIHFPGYRNVVRCLLVSFWAGNAVRCADRAPGNKLYIRTHSTRAPPLAPPPTHHRRRPPRLPPRCYRPPPFRFEVPALRAERLWRPPSLPRSTH